jgi:hypothetical protein
MAVVLGQRHDTPAATGVGAVALGGAGALDAFAIYALVTGGRRRSVALPPR